jgi:hypothetical protein
MEAPERRHGSPGEPGHAFLAWHSSWRIVVYIYLIIDISSWKFHQLTAGQLLSGHLVRCAKGRLYDPSIMYKITPAGSLSRSQPGGPPCWAGPLAFGHIGSLGGTKSYWQHRNSVILYTILTLSGLVKRSNTVHRSLQQRGVTTTLTTFEILSAPNPAANSVRNNYLSSPIVLLSCLSLIPTVPPVDPPREKGREAIYMRYYRCSSYIFR